MVDPIEIRIVGKDDSSAATESAEKSVKALGETVEKTGKQLKSSGQAAGDYADDVKDAGSSVKAAEADIESLGDAARDAGKRVKGAGDGLGDFGDKARKSGASADDATTRLDRLGESADVGESRFIGLASGIDGATSLMDDPSPQEMAQGIADLSDGIAKTAVPWLIKARDAVGGFVTEMGGMKNVLIGGGVIAAMGALGFALHDAAEEARDAKFDNLTEDLIKTGDAAKAAKDALGHEGPDFTNMFSTMPEDVTNLQQVLSRLIGEGKFEQAQELIKEAGERGDITGEQMTALSNAVDSVAAAEADAVPVTERMTKSMEEQADAIRGVNDARRAAVDPLFGMLDAMNQQRDSQRSVNEAFVAYGDAVKEHGEGSAEAADALRALNDAQDDAVMSAADLESATSDLEAQIKEHPATLSNAINSLERWKAQGSITADQAARMETRFRNAAREANRIDGTSTRNLNARDNASGKIINVGNRLRELDGASATVTLNADAIIRKVVSGFGFNAAGGPPAAFSTAAAGGAHGANVLVGEHGPELVNLPFGSMVKSNSDTQRLLADSGGPGPLTLTWAGGPSDDLGRAMWRWLQEHVQVSYGGDVNRALGG